MSTPEVLRSSVRHTHQLLAERLDRARDMASSRSRPREGYERIDIFLAAASKHLHAVDAVLLPAAGRHLADGSQLVHDYLHAERELELVLAHVKAREYGSTYEAGYSWADVWSDVEQAVAAHRHREMELVDALSEALDGPELDALAEGLHAAEATAPTRPHPYVPHTGVPGKMARKVMHAADAFWDATEGRMVPEPARPPRKPPGLLAQYILGDPRFDEEKPAQPI